MIAMYPIYPVYSSPVSEGWEMGNDKESIRMT